MALLVAYDLHPPAPFSKPEPHCKVEVIPTIYQDLIPRQMDCTSSRTSSHSRRCHCRGSRLLNDPPPSDEKRGLHLGCSLVLFHDCLRVKY